MEKSSDRVNVIIAAQLELDVPKLEAEFMQHCAELIQIFNAVAEKDEPRQSPNTDGADDKDADDNVNAEYIPSAQKKIYRRKCGKQQRFQDSKFHQWLYIHKSSAQLHHENIVS